MGCDIHIYVEKRVGSGWESLDFNAPDNRNYDVFAILAGVRNGFGFAGIPTGIGFKPIADPRGLPHDVTPETKAASDDFGGDGHSHSWLTLREIFEYDYTQTTRQEGVLTLASFAEFDYRRKHPNVWAYPEPREHSSDVYGGDVRKVYPEEARAIIDAMPVAEQQALRRKRDPFAATEGPAKGIYVRDTWTRRYLDEMRDFLCELVPLIPFGLDNVRLVFWFDN